MRSIRAGHDSRAAGMVVEKHGAAEAARRLGGYGHLRGLLQHFALRLYDNLLMKALDLGNMDQAVWQTAHGRPFYFTNMELPLHIEAFGTTTRLSFHVEPILLPLALLYRVVAGPPVPAGCAGRGGRVWERCRSRGWPATC